MSSCVSESILFRVHAFHSYWTEHFDAGDPAPVTGIYRCLSCCRETVVNAGDPLPHVHTHVHEEEARRQGWTLNVRAQTA